MLTGTNFWYVETYSNKFENWFCFVLSAAFDMKKRFSILFIYFMYILLFLQYNVHFSKQYYDMYYSLSIKTIDFRVLCFFLLFIFIIGVKNNGILFRMLFWPTVWKNCVSDQENYFDKLEPFLTCWYGKLLQILYVLYYILCAET